MTRTLELVTQLSACDANSTEILVWLLWLQVDLTVWTNCNTVMGNKTAIPLGPPGPSFFPLICLGEFRVPPAGRHLAVFTIILSQQGVRFRDLKAQCNKGCNHFLVLGSKATDLMFLSHLSNLKVLSLPCRGRCLRIFLAAGMLSPLALAFLQFCESHSFCLEESIL